MELSSPVFTGAQGVFNTKALVKRFYALPNELWDLGKDSWTRAKLNIDAMTSDADLRSVLSEMFDRECPRVDSVGVGELFLMSYPTGQYIKFFHMLNGFAETVRKIVSWEAITALVSLEGRGLGEKVGGDNASSAEAEMVKGIESLKLNKKKSEKGKKVLGDR